MSLGKTIAGEGKALPLDHKDKQALKFFGAHLCYGAAAAITFGVAVLVINLSNIRVLALNSAHPALVLGLMFFGLFVTFGSISMAVGVMGLARDEERD